MTRIHDLAHARAGDKGNTLNVAVVAYDPGDWPRLVAGLTPGRVQAAYAHLGARAVRRYLLPRLHAMNFVIEDVLGGGVTRSLRIDPHGKSLSTLILTLEL